MSPMTASIEAMAREAFPGGPDDTEAGRAWWAAHKESLTRFAALVRAQALERAASVAESTICDVHLPTGVRIYGTRAAASIRALPPLE